MQSLGRFIATRHGGSGEVSAPHTQGLVITSAWRYDLMLWLGNLATRGTWQALRRMTMDLARLRPGERVLDVGCGTGSIALLAKQRVGEGGRVCGIDPSLPMIARARRKAARRGLTIEFQPGVIERLPFPDQTFDIVLSTFMMHQIPDEVKRQGLAEIARVLTPGGRLLVVDTRRPEEPEDPEQHLGTPAHPGHRAYPAHRAHPVHIGTWRSGVQDQPALMREAGFADIEAGELDVGEVRLPEVGFAIGHISEV
jgi:ubiquinone/menaquinone biosynthesis C-methylase UbiE